MPHFCMQRAGANVGTRGAGTREAVVELGGHEPLALSPRFEVSPSPSCPLVFKPQHLTVASSCAEKQPTDRSSIDRWGESFTQGLQVHRS